MGYSDIDKLDSDPELAIALGNMVVAWARAEVTLSSVLALVCGINANMAVFGYYRIPTFEARVKFIRALMQEWKTTLDKTAIDHAVEKLSKLAKTRNDWVHGLWSRENATGEIVTFDFRAPEDMGRRKPAKAHDINSHVTAVRERTKALEDLIPWGDILP